jgi:hypothetical protein
MAIEQKYTEQFPFVGTATQRARLTAEARRRRSSLAAEIRRAIDAKFGLEDGEEPEVAKDAEVKG